MMAVDFEGARAIVDARLDELFAGERESPKTEGYGFDTGRAWAPMIEWDGVMGTYTWLVDKRTGALKALSLPEFLDMPVRRLVGRRPKAA